MEGQEHKVVKQVWTTADNKRGVDNGDKEIMQGVKESYNISCVTWVMSGKFMLLNGVFSAMVINLQ